MLLPAGSAVSGSPLPLATALSWSQDRRTQAELIRVYWRLAEAVAMYRFSMDYHLQLKQFSAKPGDETSLHTALAASLALVREAEVGVVAAQHDFAGLVMLPPEAPLPLPADRPHVGAYRTHFDELFAMRAAPGRVKLIDRMLPIRHRAIETRAAAVDAADAAMTGTIEAYQLGQAEVATVLSCAKQCLQQRQVFMASVCRYNQDIADYALAVAMPGLHSEALVAMLIRPLRDPVRPVAVEDDGLVEQTGLVQPAPTPARKWSKAEPALAPSHAPATLSGGMTPTPAPPRPPRPAGTLEPTTPPPTEETPLAGKAEPTPAPSEPKTEFPREPSLTPQGSNPKPATFGEPTLAPQQGGSEPASSHKSSGAAAGGAKPVTFGEPTLAPSQDSKPRIYGEPTLAPPRDSAPAPSAPKTLPGSRGEAKQTRAVNRPTGEAGANAGRALPNGRPAAGGLYPGLVQAAPSQRVRQLAVALYWDRGLPEGMGRPLSLAEALRGRLLGQRRAVIESYWFARQRAAQYQLLVGQAELLEELAAAITEEGPKRLPVSLRLSSAQLATEAALSEANAALLEAHFELAEHLGRAGEAVWPVPSTVPHAGQYLLLLEAMPRRLVQGWPVRRLAAIIPRLAESVQEHATAVVQTDAARAAATANLNHGAASREFVLTCISRQTEETLALLQAITDYNRAIAEYVLLVLPPETPGEKLASSLVTS